MWRKWRNKIPAIVHFKTLCTDFARTCILIFRWICSCARDRRNLLQNIFCQKQVSSDDPKMTESDFRYYVQNCWDKRFKKRVFKRRKRNFFTNFWRVTKLGKFCKFLATNFLSNDFGDFWGLVAIMINIASALPMANKSMALFEQITPYFTQNVEPLLYFAWTQCDQIKCL